MPLLPMTASDSFTADDVRVQAFRTWAETQGDSLDVMEETSEQKPREGQQEPARSNVQHPEPIDLTLDEPGQKESPKKGSMDRLPELSYSLTRGPALNKMTGRTF